MHPHVRVPCSVVRAATTAPVRPFGVLVVGSTNLRRSPVAEQLLRARLGPGTAVAVTSAGTHVLLQQRPEVPVPTTLVPQAPVPEALVADAPVAGTSGHRVLVAGARTGEAPGTSAAAAADAEAARTPRRLEPEMVEAADLVLTMSRAERAEVVRLAPGAVRRTFTLRELARVAAHLGPSALPDGHVTERLAALVAAAAPHRGPTAPHDPADDDVVAEPAGRDRWTRTTVLTQVQEAVDTVVAVVRPVTPDGPAPAGLSSDPAGRSSGSPGSPGGSAGPGRAQAGQGATPGSRARAVSRSVGPARSRRRPTGGTARSPDGRPARRRPRARTVIVGVLSSVVVVVVAVTAGAFVVMDRLDDRVDRFPDPFVGLSSRPAPFSGAGQGSATEQPLTVLVLGSADDVPLEGPQAWALAAEHTDVVMLARVSADRESAQLVTLPPDLAVDVPGSGRGTLRSAFAEGGPRSAVRTVEQLTDVRVDHIALTDSSTFARVTDALGGVDLDVASDLVQEGRVVVPAGRHRLTGEQALVWVQGAEVRGAEREAGAGHAGGRVERQEAWLRAILDRLGGADVRRDPTSWLRLLSVVSDSVAVDEGLDRGALTSLLTSLRGLRPGDVDVVAAPTTAEPASDPADAPPDPTAVTGETAGPDATGTAVVPDADPFAALMAALRADTLGEHLEGLDRDRP